MTKKRKVEAARECTLVSVSVSEEIKTKTAKVDTWAMLLPAQGRLLHGVCGSLDITIKTWTFLCVHCSFVWYF